MKEANKTKKKVNFRDKNNITPTNLFYVVTGLDTDFLLLQGKRVLFKKRLLLLLPF